MRGPFTRRDSPHRRGRRGERAGERWLTGEGYRIVARNFRTPVGEIDLVGREGEVLCFIEVKARMASTYGPAIGSISSRQRTRLVRAAALYLQRSPWDGACRFDVLGLDWDGHEWEFTLLRGAFEA